MLFRNTRQGVKGFRTVFIKLLSEENDKIDWLIDFKLHRDEKSCDLPDGGNCDLVNEILREREAICAAVFHEKMSIIERDRAAAYFADLENGAQVLLEFEYWLEGRNFHPQQIYVI